MDTKEMTHVVASPEASDHKQEPAHEQGPPIDPGHHPPPSAPPASGGKRMVGVLLGIALVAGLLGVGIAPRLRQGQKLAADAAVMTSSVPLVNVINPHPAPSTTDIVLPGNVQAIEQTTINARTSGYLRRRYVDIGSRVRAGQVLAEIEAPELDQQLLQARAETSKTQAGQEQAQADVARLQANVAQAQSDLARTQSTLEASRADLAHAGAKLQEAQSAAAEARAQLLQTQKKLNGQKAALVRAKSHLALAEKTLTRWKELARGGAVSGQELDEVQANYESNQADVASAEAEVESGEANVTAARSAVSSREGDVAAAQADVNAAQQKVRAAEAAVTSSRANVTAMQASVQASQANVRAAQAGVQASQANVNRYSAMRGFERVVAPFDGVITARNVDTGDLINAGSSNTASDPTSTVPHTGLFGIARTDVLRIQVEVPQPFISTIKPGLPARVLVPEYPGHVFPGTVFDTAGALDANSRTLLAEVRVQNPDNVLKPGMFAQIQFVTTRERPLLRIPANTLIVDSKGTRVATVMQDGKLHFQAVQVGRDYGNEVDIREGLEGNERLVTNPTDDLKEAEPVKIAAEPKE